LAHMSISTYFRPNIHQYGPEILGVMFISLVFFEEHLYAPIWQKLPKG
jgi:hypothetical protein